MTKNIKNKEDVNKITIIIINYNVSEYVNKLIFSLKIIDKYIKEIIIIDNNSTDKNQLIITTKTNIIFNKKNIGFSKAVNIGIKHSQSDYILLINPDCYLQDDSIIKSFRYLLRDNKIGAIGGKIRKHNSIEYQPSANRKVNFGTAIFEFTILKRAFPNNYFSNTFWIKTSDISKPIQVESLCGAYIIFRKKIQNKLNLFDEKYFLYLEDIDFGNKINSLKYKVIFDPRSEIIHFGGKSSNSKYNIVLKEWYKSRKIYFKKHFNFFESSILMIIFSIEETILNLITHE